MTNDSAAVSGAVVDNPPTPPPASRRRNRSWGRAVAAMAGDLLPLADFAGLLFTGFLSLSAYATLSGGSADAAGWNGLNRLVWIAACVGPFILYERRFAALATAGDRAALRRGFARRFTMVLGVIAAIAFAGRWLDQAPAGWLALWTGGALLASGMSRVALARYLRRLSKSGALAEAVAVVGSGAVADQMIPLLGQNSVLLGVFDDRGSRTGSYVHPRESTLEGLIARVSAGRAERPDRILIALPGTAEPRVLSIVERLRPLGVPVELCPQNIGLRSAPQDVGFVGDWLPVALLADRPIKRWNLVLKSAADLLLGALIAVALLPLLACIALAVKLDSPGPILFRQRRHGISNREFDIYKFRSMHGALPNPAGVLKQTVRGDDRITRVGRFLRRWSLDELPQVFNVLEGNMSLVGPRPHAVIMRTEQRLGHEITDFYMHRHRVKPGITGWAQVNGSRGATDTAQQLRRRVELDLYYVENWSFLLDLKILLLTFKAVVKTTNAY